MTDVNASAPAADARAELALKRLHELQALAAERGITGAAKLRKGELVDILADNQDGTAAQNGAPAPAADGADAAAGSPRDKSATKEVWGLAPLQPGMTFSRSDDTHGIVLSFGEFSTELCGGTHVSRTGDIGSFALTSEGSVSSGVRRVEALTARGAESWLDGRVQLIDDLSKLLKVQAERVEERISRLLEENKELKTRAPAAAPAAEGDFEKKKIGEILFVSGIFEGLDGKSLRDCFDRVKKESEKVIAVLIAPGKDKVQVLVGVTPSLTAEGWKAGDIFQAGAEQIAARGGGRPEMVQAGGTNPDGASGALKSMESRVEQGPGS